METSFLTAFITRRWAFALTLLLCVGFYLTIRSIFLLPPTFLSFTSQVNSSICSQPQNKKAKKKKRSKKFIIIYWLDNRLFWFRSVLVHIKFILNKLNKLIYQPVYLFFLVLLAFFFPDTKLFFSSPNGMFILTILLVCFRHESYLNKFKITILKIGLIL